ncbi:MAG: aminopeptidase N [Burkholderiaceae bacterium]|nr:MAG: aminopeptidase N [Burkholderiaceae bacterium]
MRSDTAPTISRHDYQPYPYRLPHVALAFDLDKTQTQVTATLSFERATEQNHPLVLNGQDLSLVSIAMDDRALPVGDYQLNDETLTVFPTKSAFTLKIVSLCRPAENSTLMGLYVSGNSLFTQCEAQGFRRITWFPDRPDVMSRYHVTLRADKTNHPLLLSNGNLQHNRDLPDGRHEVQWEDPHPKPCYLFALVAGDFSYREQSILTASNRKALLQIYSDRGSENKTAWALASLGRAVKWDETRFGLELDLDRFMVVAARDFNMGAMENKGLNIFNSSYVLADPQSATDASFRAIEGVIGHEYFHNWTGNRVTCRDWFQISLKEGLTVFRDQEFSADMLAGGLPESQAASARAVKRIDDVTALRTAQFPEDAGPMAHPIRPESYQEIGNFYTATVYEKGAEVIRMQHTLLGEQGFRAGMDEYFRRHDGSAVTCDDFVNAMDSVYRKQNPGKNLDIFRRWYSQAGTPHVKVELRYNSADHSCTITLSQHNEAVGIEKLSKPVEKLPLLIPFAIGLLNENGQPIALKHNGETRDTVILELDQKQQTWEFHDIPSEPVPSLLRNFSAPVIVDYQYTNAQLGLLARHDTDPFARWEAGQELATRQLLKLIAATQASAPLVVDPDFIQTWSAISQNTLLTPAYRSRALTLPGEKILLEKTVPMDPAAVAHARRHLRAELGKAMATIWLETYDLAERTIGDAPYSADAQSAGWRSLKNLALTYLMAGEHPQAPAKAQKQYHDASNMTDRMGGLSAIVNYADAPTRAQALADFYQQWQHDPLVVDRWFALQATAPSTRVDTVHTLMKHPAFTLRNPNRARSLIFQFCMNNLQGAHTTEGYEFWADQVIALNDLNPEIAARLARAFDNWSRFIPSNRDAIRKCYERIQQHPPLSRNVAEIVTKALKI